MVDWTREKEEKAIFLRENEETNFCNNPIKIIIAKIMG